MNQTRLQKKLEGALRYCYKMGWKASVCRIEINERQYGDKKKHPDFGISDGKYRNWKTAIDYTLESAISDLYSFKSAGKGLPANAIFIKTGPESNLFVLDLDLKNGSLRAAYNYLDSIGYKPMTDDFGIETQSGGLQIYMKGSDELWGVLSTRAHIFGDDSPIDCRGIGGIVFGPMSECKNSTDPDNPIITHYRIAAGVDPSKPNIREVHPSLLDFFRKTKQQYDTQTEHNAVECTKKYEIMSVKQKQCISEAISKCDSAPVGSRSEECFSLLRLLIKFRMQPDESFSLVRNISKFKNRDKKFFEEMWVKALPTVDFTPKYTNPSSPITTPAQTRALVTRPSISAKEILNMKYNGPPPRMIADPWLYNSGIVVLCGRPGVGKTIMALDLCRAAVFNGPCWCDTLLFQKPCKILYFHGDLSASVFVENYLKRMGLSTETDNCKIVILSEVLAMLNKPIMDGEDAKFVNFNIIDPENRKLYMEIIAEYKPDIVILDSLSSFSGADENDKRYMTEILTSLKMISDKYKHVVLALHHPRKESTNEKNRGRELTMDDIRGSSAISAHCDVVIGISNVYDDESRAKIEGRGHIHVLKAGAQGSSLNRFDDYVYQISNGINNEIFMNAVDLHEDDDGFNQFDDIDWLKALFVDSKTVYYPTLIDGIKQRYQIKLRQAISYLRRYVHAGYLIEHKEGTRKFFEFREIDMPINFSNEEE